MTNLLLFALALLLWIQVLGCSLHDTATTLARWESQYQPQPVSEEREAK